jgi:hypothetical protein
MFDRRDEGRIGKAAIGTISTRTERLVKSYLATLGAELHPDAILFRNLSGNLDREENWLMTSGRCAKRYSRATSGASWTCDVQKHSKP